MRYVIELSDGTLTNGIVTRGTNPAPKHLHDLADELGGCVRQVSDPRWPDESLDVCELVDSHVVVSAAKVSARDARAAVEQKIASSARKKQLQELAATAVGAEADAIASMLAEMV